MRIIVGASASWKNRRICRWFLRRSRQNWSLFSFLCSLRKFRLRFIKVFCRFFLHKSPWNVRGAQKGSNFPCFRWQISKFCTRRSFSLAFLFSDLLSALLEPNSKPSLISLRLQCSAYFSFLISQNFRFSSTSFSVCRSLSLNSPGPFCWIDFSGFARE